MFFACCAPGTEATTGKTLRARCLLRRNLQNGVDRSRLAATEYPAVVPMDIEMPDDDRWEAVRRLKNDPQTRDIPIIGMSADALDSEREQAIATGCNEFDAKPIEFESLVATIRRLLAPHK